MGHSPRWGNYSRPPLSWQRPLYFATLGSTQWTKSMYIVDTSLVNFSEFISKKSAVIFSRQRRFTSKPYCKYKNQAGKKVEIIGIKLGCFSFEAADAINYFHLKFFFLGANPLITIALFLICTNVFHITLMSNFSLNYFQMPNFLYT